MLSLCVCLLAGGYELRAVTEYTPLVADPLSEPWRWRDVDFLSEDAVTCLAEAPDGSIWFGAVGSLIRYDGLGIVRYDLSEVDPELFPRNEVLEVRAITINREGRPLFVINERIAVLENGEIKLLFSDAGFVSNFSKFHLLKDGSFILETRNRLTLISADLESVVVLLDLSRRDLLTMCVGYDDTVWVLAFTRDGERSFYRSRVVDGELVRQFPTERLEPPSTFFPFVANLLPSPNGGVFYCDDLKQNGILLFDPESKKWDSRKLPEHGRRHYNATTLADGTILFTGAGEVLRLKDGVFQYYNAVQLNLPITPLKLIESQGQRVWCVSFLSKVSVVDFSEKYQTYPGLHYQFDDKVGQKWFLDPLARIIVYNKVSDTWYRFNRGDGLVDDVRAVFQTKDNKVWAIGAQGGAAAVSLFQGEEDYRWKTLRFPKIAPAFTRHAWGDDGSGGLYLGSAEVVLGDGYVGGVTQVRSSQDGDVVLVRSLDLTNRIRGCRHIEVADDGQLWLAFNNLCTWDEEHAKLNFVVDIPRRRSDRLLVADDGVVWFAQGGFGIWKKDGDLLSRFSAKDGLAANNVSDLLQLDDGSLVAASVSGISRFDGQTWTPHIVPNSIFISRGGGSISRGEAGSIWFNLTDREWLRRGQVRAASRTMFSSVRYQPDAEAPETYFQAYLDKVPSSGITRLRWYGQDPWNHSRSDQLEFSWRLNSGEWSNFSATDNHAFTGLKSGDYILEVRARDTDHNIDLTPALAYFEVEVPVWRRWWVISLVSLVVSLSLILIVNIVLSRKHRLEQMQAAALERQRYLEEIDAIKTGYVNNISHELNTPVTSLMIPLETMMRTVSDERSRKKLSLALRNAERVKNLVSQLKLFRDAEKGVLSFEKTTGDICECVDERVEQIQPVAESRGVSLVKNGPKSCPVEFFQDPFEKILDNLLSNAIKYSNPDSEVRVSWEIVEGDGGQEMVLQVEDDGPGIAEEHRDHLFERFYRIPGGRMVDGAGIGLNLTKELVDFLGGEIIVESPINTSNQAPGSRFTVRIPL